MVEEIRILPADWRDLGAVWQLERACFGRDAWGAVDLLWALLSPTVRLKAVAGSRLVGFAIGEPRPPDGCAWIATLGVHPDHQRRGLGRQLLRAVETRLPQPVIKLTVRQSNAPAIALYEQTGYRKVDVWERYYLGGETGIVMEKRRP